MKPATLTGVMVAESAVFLTMSCFTTVAILIAQLGDVAVAPVEAVLQYEF